MIGPFLVAPNYQPDAAAENFAPMDIKGSLQPGSVVQLTYRVLPGNPNVVQGVRAVVVDGPKPAPTPTAAPMPCPILPDQLARLLGPLCRAARRYHG